jgi:hypothetical protein
MTRSTIVKTTIRRRKNEWGEFVVRVFTPTGHRPAADYFTDDWDDARRTAADMVGLNADAFAFSDSYVFVRPASV